MQVDNDDRCFVCGKHNPIGFKLELKLADDGKSIHTQFTPPPHFQGWHGVLHGGILSTLADEAITYVAIHAFDSPAVTAQLEVRFLKPAPIGETLDVRAWPVKSSNRFVQAEAEIRLSDGTLVTRASGKCLRVLGRMD